MNHSWKTRVLAMLLAVVMVAGLVPMTVFATEEASEKYRDVHRAERTADFGDLSGEEWQNHTQRQTCSGIGQFSDLMFAEVNWIRVHRVLPFKWFAVLNGRPHVEMRLMPG